MDNLDIGSGENRCNWGKGAIGGLESLECTPAGRLGGFGRSAQLLILDLRL